MFLLSLVITAGAVLSAAGCSNDGGASSPSGAAASPALNVSPTPATLPATVGALPPMSPEEFDGLLEDLHGTPVVVNVWASWCEPCKEETPRFTAAARANPDVQFLGVDMADSRTGAEDFIAAHEVPYPSVFDPGEDIFRHLGGGGPPLTVFYAADGTEVARVPGPVSQEKLDEELSRLTQR
jgi:thiol:disulfide interchange protein